MIYASFLLYAFFPTLVSAHGYLSSPPPRGIQKASYQVDDLKSPNHRGICRGEPEGQVTQVQSGGKLTLGFTITAPHVGPCEVHLLDFPNLVEITKFASKDNCAAPGQGQPWTIDLPKAQGRKVLRWTWLGCHVSPCEPYEQCIDVNFGGGSGGSEGYTPPSSQNPHYNESRPPPPPHRTPTYPTPANQYQSSPPSPPLPLTPSYQPLAPVYQPSPTSSNGACVHGVMQCDGSGFATCVYGSFVHQDCAPGTKCFPSGGSIICK